MGGAAAGETRIPELVGRTIHQRRGGGSFGLDRLSPVSDSYEAPFPFSGTIHVVETGITPVARAAGALAQAGAQSGDSR